MGQWEEYCTLCGGPTWGTDGYGPQYEWLNNIIGLSCNGQIERLSHYNGYGAFLMHNGLLFDSKTNATSGNSSNFTYGVVCHQACKTIFESIGHSVTFAQLYKHVGPRGILKHCKKRYVDIKQYQLQNFEIDEVFNNHDQWLLEDPLFTNANRERIMQLGVSIITNPPRSWGRSRPP